MGAELIIIGGGNSIRSFPTLWDDIVGYDVMTVNHAYRFVKETPRFHVSIDPGFWKKNDFEMSELSRRGCQLINRNNEYVCVENYNQDGNFFKGHRKLSGVFALDYAIRKLEHKRIFLFGYDFGVVNGKTHFYDEPRHGGIGKSKAYLDSDGNVLPAVKDFDNFKDCGKQIIIVGKSNIASFPKIEYAGFHRWIKGD